MIYPYEGCCSNPNGVDRHCRLSEYEADESYCCPECGRSLRRVITAPRYLNNTSEFKAFKSPVDGSIVSTQQSLREHNKRNGVTNIHDGYDEKALMAATKRNYQKELDKERAADLALDMRHAINKCEQGYKPQPAPEGAVA